MEPNQWHCTLFLFFLGKLLGRNSQYIKVAAVSAPQKFEMVCERARARKFNIPPCTTAAQTAF